MEFVPTRRLWGLTKIQASYSKYYERDPGLEAKFEDTPRFKVHVEFCILSMYSHLLKYVNAHHESPCKNVQPTRKLHNLEAQLHKTMCETVKASVTHNLC